ncbi:hypothetical protein [Niveibacterium sp. SC-1]|uniref:hypothetical protein n=1 Tax=Niveibacterium sp. SC-1 TaxID=3135646 RepID=UPI00311DB362
MYTVFYAFLTDEFSLLRIEQAARIEPGLLPRPAIMLNMGDACRVDVSGAEKSLGRGESLLLAAGADVQIQGSQLDLFLAA